MSDSLTALFDAGSVAVLGASANPRKAAGQVLKTMLEHPFQGGLFAVNPQHAEVLGLPCHASLSAIPERVDLVVVGVPARHVLDAVEQAAHRGDVRGLVILSAGFAETGIPEQVRLEREIVQLARSAGMRIVGPNCIGLINSRSGLCTSFAPGLNIRPGGIGLITQSGAFGGGLLMQLADQPIPLGFSKFAHVGNAADVNSVEMLSFLGRDEPTRVIGMYLEGVPDGRALLETARAVTLHKPVFVLKVGRTGAGAHAAFSHTGSMAGTDQVYDAAFRQSGMVRVENIEELVDACKAASLLPPTAGSRICVLTEAGGPGIIALDEIAALPGLQLAVLQPETSARLKALLPTMAVVSQPDGYIDMTAAAMEAEHAAALKQVLADPGVDQVLLISVPPTFLPALDVAAALVEAVTTARQSAPGGQPPKPVAACFMRGEAMQPARALLEQHGIPTFDTPDRAVRALVYTAQARQRLIPPGIHYP